MERETDFLHFFNERVKERGLNLKKLSDLSGISFKHLEALSYGDFNALPPAPYFRGYLVKLGDILDFDPDAWWPSIKNGDFVKNSGAEDRPPFNRFVQPKLLSFVWIGIVVLGGLLYFALQAPRIFGRPALTVTFPTANPFVSASSSVTIRGTISGEWNELTLNGESIPTDRSGAWEKNVLLDPGLNAVRINAKKFLGGEMNIIEQIIYQPESSSTSG